MLPLSFIIGKDGSQSNYGYKDGYFEKFVSRLNNLTTGFEDLISIINDSKELAAYALDQLENGEYTNEIKYIPMFDTTDSVFTLNDKTLGTKADDIYYRFADLLSNFEM